MSKEVREEEALSKVHIQWCIHRTYTGILALDNEPTKPLLNTKIGNEIYDNSVYTGCLTTIHFTDCGGHCIIH